MKDKELSAFKDGVADALLEGHSKEFYIFRSDWHENLHFYKQGYDFGLTMYAEYNKLDQDVIDTRQTKDFIRESKQILDKKVR